MDEVFQLLDYLGIQSQSTIQTYARLAHRRHLKKGEHLYHGGEDSTNLYFLISGILRGFTVSAGGKEYTECILHKYGHAHIGMIGMGVDYLTLMAFFYILPGITNGIQGYFRGMGEMKTTLTATFIQISIRALVVAVLVPRIGLNGAAWACAVGWSAMLCYTFARYRRVRENE